MAGGAQATPLVSPAAGSDAVLAMRIDAQPELRLTYKVDRASEPAEIVTLGLSTDYHYKRSDSIGLSIYDYRLKRIFRVQKESGLINDSLYAEAWYRGAELNNRANIDEALKKAGLDTAKGLPAQDPYWAETELGVITPRFPRPDLHRKQTEDRVSWSHGSDEVVAVRYREEVVPPALRRGLRRWWPSVVAIHPAIAEELAQSERVPAELWVRVLVHGKTFETAHWTLTESQFVESAKYPLPGGLAAAPTESRGAYPQIFAVLSTAVAEKRWPLPQETYVARAQAAIAHGAGLEAIVWVMEMQLAAGVETPCSAPSETDHCALAAQAGPLARMDSRTAVAFAARSPDSSDRSQFTSLPNAYLLGLLWATRPPGNGVKPENSEHDLLVALTTRPIANFCKDAGDFYASAWYPFAAWQVWDLGRLMANHRSGDLLDQVDKMEAAVVTGIPTLF
jgi:SOS response regulatory protein OraA/RecX